MRELDLLLTNYYEHTHAAWSALDHREFEYLLEYNDMDLISWLFGNDVPKGHALGELIKKIKTHNTAFTTKFPGQNAESGGPIV
mgnify:CR=1 FL=1